ncbi:MAG TPA: DUF4405 domain-containing protein [Bacteroidales bacterium]|nr:DUF4405 domain-containing protein [Bacteroidales bacterium]
MRKDRFNLRSFTSFSLLFSTIIMSWSGIILYIAPAGRVANWTNWQLMLFTKAEWQAMHTIFSYLFFILFVIHLFFVNWKAFLTYIKSKIKTGLNRKWELAAATLITVVFFIGTLRSWVPFGPVMDFGEKVKASWEKTYSNPPVAHMETFTLSQLRSTFPGVTPVEMLKVLNDSNIVASDTTITLEKIAAENKIAPIRIYEVLSSVFNSSKTSQPQGAPAGVGKLTIKDVAARLGKDPSELIRILKEKGVDATEEMTMRSAAEALSVSPHDIYGLFEGK